jgi:hypothetical protein
MIRDGVLDDLDELFLGSRRPDLMPVQQLDHETCEALECSRYTNRRAHLNEHVLSRLYVDL